MAVSLKNDYMKNLLTMLAAAGWVAASVFTSSAQPYYVAGSALIPAWSPGAAANELTGSPLSLTTGTTTNTYHQFKVTHTTWNTNWPGNDVWVKGDANGTNTFYFYPGTISDGWSPLANRIGYADPGNMTWEVTGNFTSPNWGTDPNAQMTLKAGSSGVYTNIYIVATPGTYNFKFRTPGTWAEVNFGADFGNGGANAVFTTTTPNQAVMFQLDLPNGRWQAGGPPVYCDVQFSVDMSVVVANNLVIDPGSVTVNGDAINAWGGTTCTNDPAAANTNVYTSPYFSVAVGTSMLYQFRYTSGMALVYDALGGISGVNRTLVVPNLASTNIPTVYFNDTLPTDLLNIDTDVTFSVNMTNAVGTDLVVFNNTANYVYINGDFIGWLAWDPIALYTAGLLFTETPSGSYIFTLTRTFPKGHTRSLTYKYAIDGADNEAPSYQNHFRYIRSTNGVYNLPLDTFGNQYAEPKVGGLTIGSPSGGAIPISWLPYPNVNLQTSTDLVSWVNVANTMGGSSTNWPMSSNTQFFRLIQP
jgi:hypothetical protein